MTVPKLIEQLKNKLPKDEIFRRIRGKRLVELLGLYSFELQKIQEAQELSEKSNRPVPEKKEYHHAHSSVVFNDDIQAPKPSIELPDCPFLLLDVRDEEEFEKCHIQLAKCFPKARLSRATNQFTPEVLSFKGRPEKMIVLYCDYGKYSAEAAQMFAERGFDNIFLLHDGLATFAEEYPNLVGPQAPPPVLSQSKKATAQQSAASKISKAEVRGVNPHITKKDPNAKRPWK